MADPIEAAIDATDPTAAARFTVNVKLGSSGREIPINLPVDLQAVELIDVIGFLAGPQFVDVLMRARGVRPSPIIVPSHIARA